MEQTKETAALPGYLRNVSSRESQNHFVFGTEWTFQAFSIDTFTSISISGPKLPVTSAGSVDIWQLSGSVT